MDAIEDSELAIHIPLKAIYESFLCPICLGNITDCHITSCGHIFCEQCIRECLNRRHHCPLCSAETTQDKLVKNHHFDNLLRQVMEQKDQVAKNYVNSLVSRGGRRGSQVVEDSNSGLSPIEQIYKKHTHRCLFAYEEYYEDLLRSLHQEQASCRMEFAAKLDEIRAKMNVQEEMAMQLIPPLDGSGAAGAKQNNDDRKDDDALSLLVPPTPPALLRTQSKDEAVAAAVSIQQEYKESLNAMQVKFDRAVKLLSTEFEKYMNSIAPSPFLLPVLVIISIEKRAQFRFDASLKPTDTVSDIKRLFIQRSKENGDPIVNFDPDCKFFVKRVVAPAEHKLEPIPDDLAAVADLKLIQGAEIILKGTVTLQSEFKDTCFSAKFKKGADQRLDYYRCKTCNFQWICKACAFACHKGHNIQPFMMNHKPSYGCCYCAKKNPKKCVLAGSAK